MSVTREHFRLSAEQRRFRTLLECYPRFSGYWDFESRECDVSRLQQDMGVFSHREQLMATFFISVWLGNDEAEHFPLIDAVKSLSDDDRAVITDWLNDPSFRNRLPLPG